MVYFGRGTSSPRVDGRQGRGPSTSEDTTPVNAPNADTDTEYLPWADHQDDRLDVEDGDGVEDTWMPEEEEVDEDVEGREHCPLSEVMASSSQATADEQLARARGQTTNRRAVGTTNAPTTATASIDAAISARVAEQERRIHELNQTIAGLEGNRGPVRSPPRQRDPHRGSRARDAPLDEPAPTRQRTAAGRVSGRQAEVSGEARAPMVEAALAREIRRANTGGRATLGLVNWADRLQECHVFFPNMDDGWKVEFPLFSGGTMKRSAPQNEEGVRWYHERVKRWMHSVILRRSTEHGPFWDSERRGWSFRRDSLLRILEDGMEHLSPTLPAVAPAPIPPVTLCAGIA
ncbi:unnamed protein product [Closterium sp. NIES-64]|nr:unnamed protein product [Closterium sp. NIES-64]